MYLTIIHLSRVPRAVRDAFNSKGFSTYTIAGRTYVGLPPRTTRKLNKFITKPVNLMRASGYIVVANSIRNEVMQLIQDPTAELKTIDSMHLQ